MGGGAKLRKTHTTGNGHTHFGKLGTGPDQMGFHETWGV